MAKTSFPKGPTGLRRPVLADSPRAASQPRLPSRTPSPERVQERRPILPPSGYPRYQSIPKTTVTHITLDVRPTPNVSILDELEPAVRGLYSVCGNFIWTKSEVARAAARGAGPVGAPGSGSAAESLRIGLIHNNANHDGNVHLITKLRAARAGEALDGGSEVVGIRHILEALWEMDDVDGVRVVRHFETELVAMSHKETFPNQMGNKERFPDPWVTERAKTETPEPRDTPMTDDHLDSQSDSQLDMQSDSQLDVQSDSQLDDHSDGDGQLDSPLRTSSQSYQVSEPESSTTGDPQGS